MNSRNRGRFACSVLSAAYFPPIEYFRAIGRSDRILMESGESYQKQSYRNRCNIYASDGVLPLVVPVAGSGSSAPITSVRIDYSKAWVRLHKRALVSAYRSSPFFEYYSDDIFAVLDSGEECLFNLDIRLVRLMAKLVGIKFEAEMTDGFRKEYPDGCMDFRYTLHPKKEAPSQLSDGYRGGYYQVFGDRLGFRKGLSILDLLFNEGPNAITYL